MKRTFTFLMSLFLMMGTMWAQPEVGSWYRIKVSDQDLYLTIRGYNGAGEATAYGTVPLLAKALASEDQVWTVEESGTEGVYHLKSKSGYYITHGGWNINAYDDPATKGQVSFVASGETYKIKNVNTGEWWKTQIPGWGEDALHPFCNAGEDAAALFSFETVDLEEFVSAVELTYEFKYNGEVLYTQKSFVAVGNEWPAYTVSFPYGVSAAKLEGTITEEDKVDGAITKVMELIAGELPFEAAESVEGISKWYFVKMHTNQPKYIQALEDGTIEWADAEVAEGEEESHLWGFVGDVWGMKMVSKTGKAVVSTSGDAKLGDAAQANAFVVAVCQGVEDAFCLQYADKKYLNGQNGLVASWNDNDAGSGFRVELYEEPEVDPNDYTSYIQNADLSKSSDSEKVWNTDGTKGISDGMVKVGSGSTFDFSQTITLPAGQYKMTAKAAYRYGSDEAAEYAAIEAGTETHYAKLYAETEYKNYEVGVQNRWDGASETNYYPGEENGKPFASTVNNLFVPNSSDAVKAWFGKDMYVNELVFNVQEEGEVKIGIAKTTSPDTGDYANIGAWTLTRLGDAEFDLNEEDFDLDAPAYTDVTAQYIVNAGIATNTEGWISVGGGAAYEAAVYEFYAGWDALVNTSGSLTQEVTLPEGTYRLTGKAFYRAGFAFDTKPDVSLGYLVAGENKVLVKSLGSIQGLDSYANDRGQASTAFYTDGLYDNVLEFVLEEETTLNIGYECTHEQGYSWFIVGAVKLESVQTIPGALVPLFEAQVADFTGYSSEALSSLLAVKNEWDALAASAVEMKENIAAGKMVLDADVKGVMDEMAAMMDAMPAIEKAYNAFVVARENHGLVFANSEAEADVKSAYEEVLNAADNLSNVTAVAELEAKVAEMEAARQAYVVNAVPAEGFTFDYTFMVVNPDMENGNSNWEGGWSHAGSTYTNGDISISKFTEKWVSRGEDNQGRLGNTSVYQTIKNLPSGVYSVTAAINATRQDPNVDQKAAATGVYLFGNDSTVAVATYDGKPEIFTLEEVVVVAGELTIGIKCVDSWANWVGFDNVRLAYTGSLPESVLLELKKEAFLARAAKFEEFINNDVDRNLTMINMTHLYPVQDEVLGNADYGLVGLVDRMDEVTEIAVLDEWMAEMDKVEAMLKDARVAAAEFSKWQGMIMDAVGFVDTYDEEAAMAAMQYLEFNVGYNCTSVEDIQTATTGAEQAYKNFVLTATPAEGHVFDMSFLLVNPNFDVNMDGWTPNKANRIDGEGYDGVGGIAEIGEWSASSWDASMSQAITDLPNGKYVVKAAWMAASGIQMTFAANAGETTVTGIGDTGGNIAKNGTVVEMGQGHRGWQYVEVEGLVEDGTLTILVSSSAQAAYQWSNADAFELYYAGTVPSKVTLDKTEAALEIEEGKTAQLQLTATIEPADVTLKTLTWESDNEEVATVDANGLVTAVGEGQAVITVTTASGAKAECVVNVSIVDAIDVVNADTETEIYDLSGRRVEKMQKGIYIVNGRKVVIK